MARKRKSPITLLEPPKWLQEIFDYEWRRARYVLSPALKGINKPKFYVSNRNAKRFYGFCRGSKKIFSQMVNGKWVRTQFIIWVTNTWLEKNKDNKEEIVRLLRHEICHCVHQNHSRNFHTCLRSLINDYGKKEEKLKEQIAKRERQVL